MSTQLPSQNEDPFRLRGTTVLVTGAARGLGHALVNALAAAGCARIFATFRNEDSALTSALSSLDVVRPVIVDVTVAESVAAAAAACPELDVLVNNAGIIAGTPTLGVDLDQGRLEMETNYWGVLRMTRAFAPQLRSSPDAMLVNILSLGALASLPSCGTYCDSKAAMWSATQSLRTEFADDGVRVAAVFPGAIATDMDQTRSMEGRCPPHIVANNIVDSILNGALNIFPDPQSEQISEIYSKNPWVLSEIFSDSK